MIALATAHAARGEPIEGGALLDDLLARVTDEALRSSLGAVGEALARGTEPRRHCSGRPSR